VSGDVAEIAGDQDRQRAPDEEDESDVHHHVERHGPGRDMVLAQEVELLDRQPSLAMPYSAREPSAVAVFMERIRLAQSRTTMSPDTAVDPVIFSNAPT